MRTSLQRLPVLIAFLFFPSLGGLSAQEIMTAVQYFDAVSENYGTIEDYQAEITITRADQIFTGTLYYRRPNLMRINFSDPAEQVLVVNDEKLMLHLPQHHVVMQQELTPHSQANLASMASSQGLKMLKQAYSVAFFEGPQLVPLDEESGESVRKLKLAWRKPGEGFRQIIMSVNNDMMIRRMEGLTAEYEQFRFDFLDIEVNQGIPAARFDYDSPPSAYKIDNFLFTPGS
jgi:outer membrane lipoprotein-sorting protein